MADRVKILSYGGGLNSFAMLLYSIDQGNPPDWCVFADTGSGGPEQWSEDGEWYGTYQHMVEYAIPICEQYGIQFQWITHRDSKVRGKDSLLQYFEYLRVVPDMGPRRYCTEAAKIERIEQWMWETFGDTPLEVWIGFEAGEENRRDKDPHGAKTCGQAEEPGGVPEPPQRKSKYPLNRINIFPLIGAGLCRCRCEVFVRDLQYPVPRKSACWFCPYSKRGDWMTLAQQMPDSFSRAAGLEENQKGTKAGKILAFNYISRKKKRIASPLWENILLPYTPKVEACDVCGRYPKATKAPGVEYLTPEEYVQHEEPDGVWTPAPWSPGVPVPGGEGEASLGAVAMEAEPATLLRPLTLTQQNILQWLSARLDAPLVDGALAIPMDPGAFQEVGARLGWFREHTQIDRDLNPDSEKDVEALMVQMDTAFSSK